MQGSRRWFLVGTIAVLLCAMAAVVRVAVPVGNAQPGGPSSGQGGPLAVVLVPGRARSELVVVDLDQARVVRRVALRSLVTDIDVDRASGKVVGAQTGGIGADADDAISICDARTGVVHYVTLPRTDPSQVECVNGTALVLHAWLDSSGYVVSAVDIASESVTATGHAPEGTGLWAAAGGSVWTSVLSTGSPSHSLVRLDPVTLLPATVACAGIDPAAVTATGDDVAVLGSSRGDAKATGSAALIEPERGRVVATHAVLAMPHGPQIAAAAGDVVVVSDWNGDPPESDRLVALEGRTLEPIARFRVGTAPCALAADGDRLLVVDRVDGVLRSVEPRTGRVFWSVGLGVRDLLCSKVVVIARGPDAGHP